MTTDIQLSSGPITAVRTSSIIIARGIPYAHAPRFSRPEPLASWAGTLDCTKSGPICPQPASRLDALTGTISSGRSMSEDCLTVTVYAPANPAKPVPVMAWLHGGGYMTGAGDLACYSGEGLASCGVVVVAINHRLGLLGYQPCKERNIPANLGLMDQIAALNWIQENVAHLGGDKHQVCLFGESAGADSIYALLGANDTQGLFHRVIMQSAPLGLRLSDRSEMLLALEATAAESLPQNERTAAVGTVLGVLGQLQGKALGFATGAMPFGPIEGHYPLPDLEAFNARVQESVGRIPILIGYNADEGTGFVPLWGRLDESVRPSVARPADYMTATYFQEPADKFIQDAESEKMSRYRFTVTPSHSPWKSAHTLELPFLLGSWDDWKDAPMLAGISEVTLTRLRGEMRALWVAFAKGGQVKGDYVIDETFVSKPRPRPIHSRRLTNKIVGHTQECGRCCECS